MKQTQLSGYLFKTVLSAVVLCILIFAAPQNSSAQLYWDLNGTVLGAGATPTGTWSTSAANWNSVADGTGATAVWVNGSAAVFSADSDAINAYTVTLTTGLSVTGITVEDGAPTISGAFTLSLASPATITVNAGRTLIMGSTAVLGGSSGLTINGAGIFQFSSASTYTGDTFLNSGVARLLTTTATFGTSSLGTLNLNGGAIHQNVGSRSLDNPIVMNGDTLIYAPPTGGGTRYLFIGATGKSFTTSGGTLTVSNETTAINASLNTFSVRFQTNVTFTQPIVLQSTVPGLHDASIDTYAIEGTLQTFSGDISGSGYFRRLFGANNTGNARTHPGGDTVLSGNNTFSGGMLINGGFIGFASSSTGPANSVTTSPAGTGIIYINASAVNGNSIAVNDNTVVGMYATNGPQIVGNRVFIEKSTNIIFKGTNDLTLSGRVSLPTLQSLVFQVTNTGLTTLSGLVDAGWSDFTLTKMGSGTLIISGDATYLHKTAVTEGKLVVNGPLSGSPSVNVTNTATLAGTGTITGPVTCSAIVRVGVSAPGILTLQGGLDLSAGGTYLWQLGANSTSTAGTDFDQIVLGGNLALGPSTKFSIAFIGTATTPTNSESFWQSAHSWRVISFSGGSNSGDTIFGSVLNGSFAAGFFTVSNDAQGVLLNYTPNVGAIAPGISLQPQNVTTNYGGTASFVSTANGTAPLTYRWKKAGVNVNNGVTASGAVISGATTTNLTISSATYQESGSYTLAVTNSSGDTESFAATLTVVDPIITGQPANQTNTAGTTATFSVTASGSAPISYQWQKNGSPLSNGGNISGATNATLTITGVNFPDAGNYYVVVSGPSGQQATSSTAKLVWFSGSPPIGLWQLNEGSGQVIADSSGHGLHGYLGTSSSDLLQDATWSTSGSTLDPAGGNSLNFPGGTIDDRARVNDNPLLTPASGNLTLSVDIEPENDTVKTGVFVSKHSSGSSGSYLLDFTSFNATTGDAVIEFMVVNSSSTRVDLDWTMPASERANGWHQVVGTYDGATMRLYFDGILRATTAQSGAIKSVSTPFQIGEFNGNNSGWEYEGLIDNVALFDTALHDGGVAVGQAAVTGSGIYQLYHQGASIFVPSLTITSFSISGGNVFLNISKQNVISYSVKRATDLNGPWTTVATGQTAAQFSEPLPGQAAFYQLVSP